MRVSLRWLREYLDLPTDDPTEIADVVASLGHEVEGQEVLEAAFSGVVVGRVETVEPHPNADRLRFCTVTTGGEELHEIVCGAWNFEAGAVVPVSLPGAVLAGGLEVGIRKIRGVSSAGMICSAAELGLGEDHSGIMVLDPTTPIGIDFVETLPLPDVVLDISITPNRPDVMSMVGLARELAAYFDVETRLPDDTVTESDPVSNVKIVIEDTHGCPRYVGREVAGVTVGPAPLWMQLRLRAAGVRPINNLVDITNYVMLELGQPLHAFDLDEVADETVIVRRARAGERLRTLDGVDRNLDPLDLMICDGKRVVAFAGIMGGEESEVTDTTTRVLIEAAHFDPPTVMFSSKRHALRTEASARFERGVDPNLPGSAAARSARLMAELAGGRALGGVQDNYPQRREPWEVALPLRLVERVLGVPFERDAVADLLRRLHLEVDGDDPLRVRVPTYRPDLTRPIDLVEEVARLYGYDRFPETTPTGPAGGLTPEQQLDRRIREVLIGAGYAEAHTMSFLGKTDLDHLGLAEGDLRRRAIRMRNPLRDEESLLRTTLLPNLLKAARYNLSHGVENVGLFEVGKVFLDEPSPDDPRVPHQPDHVAFVAVGITGPSGLLSTGRSADVFTATGTWTKLIEELGIGGAEIRQTTVPVLHPGRAAEALLDGEVIGMMGELHPAVARAFELEGRVAVGELRMSPLVTARAWWQFSEPSTYPPVAFDLAFELGKDIPAAAAEAAIRGTAGNWLEEVRVFDEFRGPPLPEGSKSVALRLTFRAPDHTLTNEEVAPVRERIIDAVAAATGGRLRGG